MLKLIELLFAWVIEQIWNDDLTNDQRNNLEGQYKKFLKENCYDPYYFKGDNILECINPTDNASEAGGYELRAIYYDPLVLDLNHNGVIDTANIENGAYFDGGNDDFSEKMGWVSGGDGLLCIDKNNDKLIDSSELFGNSSDILYLDSVYENGVTLKNFLVDIRNRIR